MRMATLGKALVTATAVAQMVGPYVFDFNETHIYNDSWPPHAKFHNAQTMSSGVALSIATLANLWRPGSGRVGVDAAAFAASTYWLSQLSAFFYPGTASVDPPGEDDWPQLKFTIPMLTVIGVGWFLARRGLAGTRQR
ncbi:DUF6640 family protein [Curtobacterium sp. MCPF17_031]|uniref:DUF6640 family protein n=1 Tax=Curtobacterium sp. MCPF17_031 TaxID=2175653 RepID=UPI000DAA04C2|nr:DUF6640 family protein [Curtobacterium sp. MCPF17_031]PZE37868.1 acetyltransferase [Curtobacterium sp. MCPF17_031]